jgi:hypothetical protein
MKRIEFKATTQHKTSGNVSEEIIPVHARDLNSGFRKAAKLATRQREWEIVSVAFWQVTS